MEEYTIRRFNISGKWIELWLDGLEYTSDETVWNEESESLISTGDKQWNYSTKLGYFMQAFSDVFNDSPYFFNIIGLKVTIDKDDKLVFKS